MNDSEYTMPFPLCEATGVPVGCKMEEERLERELPVNERVKLKLSVGAQPTVQEEMLCTLSCDLPGEEWITVQEYDGRYQVSNKRRLRKSDGDIIHLVGGFFRTDKRGKTVFINPTKLAVEYFEYEQLRPDPLLDKYRVKFAYNNIVERKLKTGEKLTSDEITFCTLDINLPGEEWKPVVGWEDLYEVSNLGRIRSHLSRKIITPFKNQKGYVNLKFYRNGISTTVKVHSTVLFTWKPKTEEDIQLGRDQVNHKDGDKRNNAITNLEWNTNSENGLHAVANNLRPPKLTLELVIKSAKLYDQDYTFADISNILKVEDGVSVNPDAISDALFRKTHKWITPEMVPIPNRKR